VSAFYLALRITKRYALPTPYLSAYRSTAEPPLTAPLPLTEAFHLSRL